ncbi:DUF1345 domain-containing protein [uncultured Devosia sp.]|uniref:DUF1345 domain-containing protein n=1 Tax=uncultured Devosia sp. TaxID=211434 RepID=UPI002603FA94|nr:DUF1345 domain-containing protein [uncultured Devosia sp.]
MPRHAPFYLSLVCGAAALATAIWLLPDYAVSLGSNVLFVVFLGLTYIKLPHLTSDYLREHAQEEDTPGAGIFLIVFIVVMASIVSLFLALSGGQDPDPWQVVASVISVLLGWFTVQTLGALHYAYEYYQAPATGEDGEVEGGLEFQGDSDPDGADFMYFSYTVGTSVATSDTKTTSSNMRRLVVYHLVFSHLYNTLILASAVNVMLSLGSGSS